VPFEEKKKKLETDLQQYFAEGEKLQQKILQNLKELEH
jgi:hypothetical protein